MTKPELFDVVQLLTPLPDHNLQIGSQGAIVDEYEGEFYEVEFTDRKGETLALVTLSSEQFVVVWRSVTKKWVPIAEKIEALLPGLSEETCVEIFHFARLALSHQQTAQTG
jgi:Domain of unknown function (DUF4926)